MEFIVIPQDLLFIVFASTIDVTAEYDILMIISHINISNLKLSNPNLNFHKQESRLIIEVLKFIMFSIDGL